MPLFLICLLTDWVSLRCWTVGFLVATDADENIDVGAAVMFELLDDDIWFDDFLDVFVLGGICDELSLSELARDDDLDETSLSIFFG